jgi:hypothetical protein
MSSSSALSVVVAAHVTPFCELTINLENGILIYPGKADHVRTVMIGRTRNFA